MFFNKKSMIPKSPKSAKKSQNILVRYMDSLEAFQEEHADYIGDFCVEYMRKLKFGGWNPGSRCASYRFLDNKGYDDDCTVEIFFPVLNHLDNDVSGSCTCEESEGMFSCEHTFAACELLLQRLSDRNDPLSVTLSDEDTADDPVARLESKIESLKRSLGLIPPSAPRAPAAPPKPTFLTTLDSLIKKQELVEVTNSNRPMSASTRLQWRVTVTETYNGRTFLVAPTEQELKKDGTSWKKGKVRNWMQVSNGEGSFSGPQDEAVRIVSKKTTSTSASYGYGGYGCYYGPQPDPCDVLEALAGSTRVVLAVPGVEVDTPLDITAGPLSLKCEVFESVLRLIPLCNGRAIARTQRLSKDNKNRVIAVGGSSIDVIQCPNADMQQLAIELIQQDATVPLAEASDLLLRFAKLGSVLKVEMPSELLGSSVVADKRTFMELVTMQPQGLCVRLRARPFEGAACVLPGDHRAAMHVVRDGQLVEVLRDVDREEHQARNIAIELEMHRFPQMTDWDWRIPADDAMLDFLVELADRQRSQCIVIEATNATGTMTETEPGSTALVPVVPLVSNLQELGQIPNSPDLVVLWPKGDEIRITGEIDVASLQLEVEDRDDWFGLKGTVRIDGHEIPLMKLIAAMKAGRRIVPLGGGLFARISDEFYERLQAIGDIVHQTTKGLEVDITAAPALKEFVDCGDNLKLCASWHTMMRRLDEAADVSADPPLSLTADLREYQLEGYRWMKRLSAWGVGGCLADDMGLGKTVQALALLLDRKEEGPTLVVAPMSVGFNWLREAERFAPSLNVLAYR